MQGDKRLEPLYKAASDSVLKKLRQKARPGDRLDEFVEYQLKRINDYNSIEPGRYTPDEQRQIVDGCIKRLANVLSQYNSKEAELLHSVATAILKGKEVEVKPDPETRPPAPQQSDELPEGAQECSPEQQ